MNQKYKYTCPNCGYEMILETANSCPICPVCGFHDCGEWEVEIIKEDTA